MTPTEFQYIKRAVEQLEKTMPLEDRIKIERVISEITARSAKQLEERLVDSLI
jgi:hypothetical protein